MHIRKHTVRSTKATLLDPDVRGLMRERDQLKRTAVSSGSSDDWQNHCSLRNKGTKLNKQKKGYITNSELTK